MSKNKAIGAFTELLKSLEKQLSWDIITYCIAALEWTSYKHPMADEKFAQSRTLPVSVGCVGGKQGDG